MSSKTKPLTTPITEIPVGRSIAVLPFADLSAQKDQEYFCDGLADELINRLTNIESLRVPARTSTFSFKGKEIDIQDVGKKLCVDMLLEGSLRKAGNKLRITVQLVNVADGYPLWSDKYERNEECIGEYKKALVLDPLSLQIRTLFGEFLRISGRLEEAEGELNRVLDMDPTFGLAQYYSAFLHIRRKKYKKAVASLQKGIKLTGGLPWAIGWLGVTYAKMGETQKAKKILQDLLELSKQRYIHPSSIAVVYEGFGDLDKFFEWLDIAVKEHDPYMPLLKNWTAFIEEERRFRSDPRFKELLKKIGLE